jgi:hypothetical protein
MGKINRAFKKSDGSQAVKMGIARFKWHNRLTKGLMSALHWREGRHPTLRGLILKRVAGSGNKYGSNSRTAKGTA